MGAKDYTMGEEQCLKLTLGSEDTTRSGTGQLRISEAVLAIASRPDSESTLPVIGR